VQARLVKDHGSLKIEINGKIMPFVSFRSFWPQPGITKDFYEGGIQLMSVYPSGILCTLDVPYSQFGEFWLGEGKYDWDVVRAQVNQFLENAPNAYFSLILQLDTRDWFLKEHPECENSFRHLPEACCCKAWREIAKQCIRDILAFLDKEYPEKFYAVYVCAGSTCEWINREPMGYQVLKEAAFKEYTGDPTRKLPTDEEKLKGQYGTLLGAEDQNSIDYLNFINDIAYETLAEFAHEVKLYNPGLLVGCFSGYSLVFNTQIAEKTHMFTRKLLANPDIEIVFSPASYRYRGLESVSQSQAPMAAFHLHDKLYYHEIDNTTYVSNSNPYAQVLQSYAHRRHASLRESIQYARREAACVFGALGTYWWFDMFGGWYDDRELQNELLKIGAAQERLYSKPIASNAQVAVCYDEHSTSRVIGTKNHLHHHCVDEQAEKLGRMGCMADHFMAEDLLLDKFNFDQYKLYIFPDMVSPQKEMRDLIARLRKMGKNILFLYAPGILRDGEMNPAFMEELTGIRLGIDEKKQGHAVAHDGPYNDDGMERVFGGAMDGMKPYICGLEDEKYAFAHGLVNKTQRMIVKERENGGFDAWIAQGPVPEFVLRPLARKAGVHIWNEDSIPLFHNSRMISIYAHKAGRYELKVPWTRGKLEDMYTDETHIIQADEPIILDFEIDECKCFIYEEG